MLINTMIMIDLGGRLRVSCLKGAFILLIMVMVRSECGMGVSQMKSIMPSLVSNSMI